jgi:pimeloyl-ACP methyl ester carboxylesterase
LPRPRPKPRPKPAQQRSTTAFERALNDLRDPAAPPATVSPRWLLGAIALAIAGAAVCCWGALCLLFWQGSWQLLYHPASAVTRTPASASIPFDSVAFAAAETGQTRLTGWWIPADASAQFPRFTVLYLHEQDGNLSNAVGELATLHAVGVNVLAFDYRGYGQSEFARPGEGRWREDAEWALEYLTGTRHIAAGLILLDGRDLGANLALEVAAMHPELAGVILHDPMADPAQIIFTDARAKLVPARLLVRDRFDLDAAAAALHIPSLWLIDASPKQLTVQPEKPEAFGKIPAPKVFVQLNQMVALKQDAVGRSLSDWLTNLNVKKDDPAAASSTEK